MTVAADDDDDDDDAAGRDANGVNDGLPLAVFVCVVGDDEDVSVAAGNDGTNTVAVANAAGTATGATNGGGGTAGVADADDDVVRAARHVVIFSFSSVSAFNCSTVNG
jgi:hypothetical protein